MQVKVLLDADEAEDLALGSGFDSLDRHTFDNVVVLSEGPLRVLIAWQASAKTSESSQTSMTLPVGGTHG